MPRGHQNQIPWDKPRRRNLFSGAGKKHATHHQTTRREPNRRKKQCSSPKVALENLEGVRSAGSKHWNLIVLKIGTGALQRNWKDLTKKDSGGRPADNQSIGDFEAELQIKAHRYQRRG
jgi:hypothetical protein